MVIDTCIFLWYIQDSPRLPQFLKDRMASDPSKVFLPAICVWEILMLAEKKRIGFDVPDVEAHIRNAIASSGFQEASINIEIAILSRTLPFEHGDPADRLIAATAKYLNKPLLTTDTNLKRLWWLKTVNLSHP